MSSRKRFTAEQIITKLREAEVALAEGRTVGQMVRKLGVSEQTYYRWRREYGGLLTEEVVPQIPVITKHPEAVSYEPLAEATHDPDVVLLRLTGRQLMVLMDAVPGLRVEGKPQCHIVAVAKEQGEMAASVGCQLSRVRTGMTNAEMTCAVPRAEVEDLIDRLAATAAADQTVAAYAADDARRFPAV